MQIRYPLMALAALSVAGCHTDMWRQPRGEALAESTLFPDGAMSRPLVPGTVARGHARLDEPFYTGAMDGKWVDELPVPLTKALLERGKERFTIYCTPCHGATGDGKGMIAQRGFQLKRPVGNYHTDRLREMPLGHFYDVITNGYGTMYSYASRIEPEDRWAIVAYIRALQLSQNAAVSDADATALEESLKPKTEEKAGDHAEGGAH